MDYSLEILALLVSLGAWLLPEGFFKKSSEYIFNVPAMSIYRSDLIKGMV